MVFDSHYLLKAIRGDYSKICHPFAAVVSLFICLARFFVIVDLLQNSRG